MTVTDDDTAGATMDPEAISVFAGNSNTPDVVLDSEPTDDVAATVTVPDDAELTVDQTSPTLTDTDWDTPGLGHPPDWDTPRTVTVTGNDDAAAATVALSHSAAGGDYTTVTVYRVEVKLLATPATPVIHAGLTISKLDLKVPEGGSESYSFVLKHKPSADVSMAVSLPTGNDLSIDETSLTFTPDDWATTQSITVSAAQDDDGDTDAEVTITHTISGGQYDDLPMPDVGVTITENDTPGVALSKTSLTVDEGGTGTHTVVLDTKPSRDVTVARMDPTDNTDVTASPASLTLTKDNWSTVQTVTVSAAQDQCRAGHGPPGRHRHRNACHGFDRHGLRSPHGGQRGCHRNRR